MRSSVGSVDGAVVVCRGASGGWRLVYVVGLLWGCVVVGAGWDTCGGAVAGGAVAAPSGGAQRVAGAWLVFAKVRGGCPRGCHGVGPVVCARVWGVGWVAPCLAGAAGVGVVLALLGYAVGGPRWAGVRGCRAW